MYHFNKQIDDILESGDYDSALLTVNIDKKIEEKLYDYQVLHTQNLIKSLDDNKIAIDTSDTGCGKTYCALAACKNNNLSPIIVCPKTIMTTWYKICELFEVKPLFVCNYETLRKCKYYLDNERTTCPYLTFDNEMKSFDWKNISENNIIIFDEVHYCRNKSTLNGKLLLSAQKYKTLLLSATLVDNIETFEIFTYMLGWCNNIHRTKKYLSAQTNKFTNGSFINEKLYPKFASRISIKELGDKFPQNNIISETYNDDNYELIDEEYKKIKNYYKKLDEKQNKTKNADILVDISYSRQKIELYKIGIIVDLANQYINNKFSIVIFVNFNKTIELLSKMLNTNCIISGKVNDDERQKNLNNFQSNKEKIIICNIAAGGQSINLHDVKGGYPRVSLIVPSYSSTQLIQALGRIHRAGSKSPATQRIIFCYGTVEDHISKKLNDKIKLLSEINDDDLDFII